MSDVKQVTTVNVLVEIRLTYVLDEGEEVSDIIDRVQEKFDEYENTDEFDVEGADARGHMVHVHEGETDEVDEDASW